MEHHVQAELVLEVDEHLVQEDLELVVTQVRSHTVEWNRQLEHHIHRGQVLCPGEDHLPGSVTSKGVTATDNFCNIF